MPILVKIVFLSLAAGILWIAQTYFDVKPVSPFTIHSAEVSDHKPRTSGIEVPSAKAPPDVSTEKAHQRIDINEATARDLESLPGIGPKLAEAIIRFRDRQGGLEDAKQLREVKGIGEKRFSAISEQLTIRQKHDNASLNVVDVNQATVQDLESLHGIGPKLAQDIIRFRDEHGRIEDLAQLTELRGIGEKRFAVISHRLTVD
jgi:competence protein ComEA